MDSEGATYKWQTESQYIELAYSSIKVFSDDGTLDVGELNFLMGLALKDEKIDADEKRVLGSIFDKVSKAQVSSAVWERIQEIRRKYEI